MVSIPQGPGSLLNSDMVDSINANRKPMPNYLVPLDSTGKFPISTIPTSSGGGSGFLLGNGAPTDKNILVADGTLWQSRTMSGDASITADTGTLTLANSGVTAGTYGDASHSAHITFDAKGRATSASSVSIAIDASAITSGTLPIARGGTNQTAFTSGSVIFFDGTSLNQDNSDLFWDNTNKRLGIGTSAAPSVTFEVFSASTLFPTAHLRSSVAGGQTTLLIENTVSGGWIEIKPASSGSFASGIVFDNSSASQVWELVNFQVSFGGFPVNTFGFNNLSSGHAVLVANPSNDYVYMPFGLGVKTTASTYSVEVSGDVNLTGVYRVSGTAGVSGTFTSQDGHTITVTSGIITAIV